MASETYSSYSASLVYAGPTTQNFTQVVGHSQVPGSSKSRVVPGGAVDAGACILGMSDSIVTVTLEDLVTLFTPPVSISAGLYCTGGATFRYQQRAVGGTFSGGSTNVTLTSSGGFAFIRRITARVDSPAQAEMVYVPFWDGSTEPLVRNTGAAIAVTPAFVSQFWLGPVYVNGTLIEGVQEITVDTGITFRMFRAGNDPHARRGSIISRLPTISFRTLDMGSAVLGTAYNAALAGTIAAYFSKGTDGGSRVAAATGSHCKVSAASGSWSPENFSVDGTGDGMITVSAQPTSVCAAVTNSAIP